jgi:hypothetical protein
MYAHWCARNYNESLIPGNDCAMGVLNEKFDYFLGNSSSTTGGTPAHPPAPASRALPCHAPCYHAGHTSWLHTQPGSQD